MSLELSRRHLFRLGTAFAGAKLVEAIVGQAPNILAPAYQAVADVLVASSIRNAEGLASEREMRQLADRLRTWRLPNGVLMHTLSPEVWDAAGAFVSPDVSRFFPRSTPLKLIYSDKQTAEIDGSLYTQPTYDTEGDTKIEVTYKGDTFYYYLVKEIKPVIYLPERCRGTNLELVIAAKEASQLVEDERYSRMYMRSLEGMGFKFNLVGSNSKGVSQRLLEMSIANYRASTQQQQGVQPYYHVLVDTFSHFRVGSIAFANWLISYPKERGLASKGFLDVGNGIAGFLQNEGYIAVRGNAAYWTRKHAPEIEDPESLVLIKKLVKNL